MSINKYTIDHNYLVATHAFATMQNTDPYPVFDFSTSALPRYTGYYCKIIDGVFSQEDCAKLIALAESDAKWQQAAVHYGLGAKDNYVDTEYRNSERILRFDHTAAEQLFQKLLPCITELNELRSGVPYSQSIVGAAALKKPLKYKLVG